MFSDELYKRLIEEPKPTVEDKYGVHFEYGDLYSRLLQVKQSQSKVTQVPQLPNVTHMRRSGGSTDRTGKRAASSNRLRSNFTLDLKSTSPQRMKKAKQPAKDTGAMLRTISFKTSHQKSIAVRRASGERIGSVYGQAIKRGKKISLR